MGLSIETDSSKRPYDNSHYFCEICFKEIKEKNCVYIEIDWVEDNVSNGASAHCHRKCFKKELENLRGRESV